MQIRAQAQYYGLRWAGIGLLIAGISLVIVGLAYYGNLFWIRSNVDNYAAQRQDAQPLPASAGLQAPDGARIVTPLALPPGTYDDAVTGLGFTPLGPSDAQPLGTLPPVERLIVPQLGINAKMSQGGVSGAAVLAAAQGNLGEGLDVVQANPGERGALWLFGDAGQGAHNFGGLEKAGDLLEKGEDILIFVDNGANAYLYAASHTDVIPADDLRLSGSGRSTIHLTVPVPSGMYDHYLVLSGELVGIK